MNNLENMDPHFRRFVEKIDKVVKMETEEKTITSKVAEHMGDLLKHEDIIPEAYKKPNPDKYTLYPLYVAPDNSFSIASAVWDVGQSTPIHDHRTWGVIGIVQGEENEIHYEFSTNAQPKKVMERQLKKGMSLFAARLIKMSTKSLVLQMYRALESMFTEETSGKSSGECTIWKQGR
ncbi:hypothetical protein DCC39_18200 [Pueribacillus theae]|uniref:Cysteine dioxygenase n=1 Tax=Pueribacillus theae TaxID=2171751 RepID=A0A2U1JJE2_9BACI|nr:hypothetical protein [Pueribacillus theae]PWA05286.1 hypothetical protein DCC39_18200 [Pueribacillus theae]